MPVQKHALRIGKGHNIVTTDHPTQIETEIRKDGKNSL